jgi:hypothetical protein
MLEVNQRIFTTNMCMVLIFCYMYELRKLFKLIAVVALGRSWFKWCSIALYHSEQTWVSVNIIHRQFFSRYLERKSRCFVQKLIWDSWYWWTCSLRRRPATAWLPGLRESHWEHGCSSLVLVVCCVGSGLCDKLITPSEESYQVHVFNSV